VVKDPLDYFDVVEVVGPLEAKYHQVIGKTGYVSGLCYEEPGDPIQGYGVWIYDLEQGWSFDRMELKYLGYKDEIAEREREASRPSIRVSRDGKIL